MPRRTTKTKRMAKAKAIADAHNALRKLDTVRESADAKADTPR